mmetsp:Transcript_29076/g.60576  ORF Transcript_29076/g.60576 Transcript_29076/m.60576 type:complete len:132 (-) Transcript_29076:311-706(-)
MDPSRELALVDPGSRHMPPPDSHDYVNSMSPGNGHESSSSGSPISIATISSGFEKGDFLVREEKGQRVYFDFFEEAFNYIAYKGYIRMGKEDEREWMDTMNNVHASVKGGMKYNTGKLLMVLSRPIEHEKE